VIFGTKCPSIISIWSHEAPESIILEHSAPRFAKSAERIEGAMMAAGDIVVVSQTLSSRIPCVKYSLCSISDSLEEAWSLIGVVRCRKHLPCPGNSSDRGVLSERFKVGQKSWHVLGSFIPFGPFDLLSFPPNIRRIVKSLTPFSLDF